MKVTFVLTFLLSIACFASAKPKKEVPYIFLNADDVLQVEVIDSLYMNGMGEVDRFHRIKTSLEEVFREIDFPVAVKIDRFSSRRPLPNQPRLQINIMRWGDNGLNEIEARFSARLRRDYDRNRLGIFFARSPMPLGSSSRTIRTHSEVMEEALAEMVVELNERLTVADLEEAEIELSDDEDASQNE